MKVNIITTGYGSNEIGINNSNSNIRNLLDKSDIVYNNIETNEKESDYQLESSLKNLSKVIYYNEILANRIYKDSESNFCLTLGGDHSISLGSVSGLSKRYQDLGLIWIDAHGDMNTEKTSPSGNIHGMILAALQGYGNQELVDLFYKGQKIKTENIIIFGVRDLDTEEEKLINDIGVKYITFNEIKTKSLEVSVRELIDYFDKGIKVDNIHLSIDLDSIDPILSPGVSVPVKDGFSVSDVLYIVNNLFNNAKVMSADIVEYNIDYDKDNKTRNILEKLITLFLGLTQQD